MSKLLRMELVKLAPYKPLWILLALFAILLPSSYYVLGLAASEFGLNIPEGGKVLVYHFNDFPDLWYHLCYGASWFNILFGVIIVLLVGNEFNFRTARQNIIDGLERRDVILAKLLVIMLLALTATTFVFVVGLAFGLVNSTEISLALVAERLSFLLGYFVQLLGYMTAGLLVGLLCKRGTLALIIYVFFIPFEIFLNFIMVLFSSSLHDLLPFSAMSSIIKSIYFLKFVDALTQPLASDPFNESFFISLAYVFLFVGCSFVIIRKSDL